MKKKQTLLEIAKQRKTGRSKSPITPDVIELAVAWASGEVALAQASAALGLPPRWCRNLRANGPCIGCLRERAQAMSFINQGETDRENQAVGPDNYEYRCSMCSGNRQTCTCWDDPDALYDVWRDKQDEEKKP